MNWIKEQDDTLGEEWRLEIPAIKGYYGSECAKYTVNYCKYDNNWQSNWWHGNQGIQIGKDGTEADWTYFKTKEEAQENCIKHFKNLVKRLNETLYLFSII